LLFPNLNLADPEKCRDSVDLGGMKNSQWAICDKIEINILDLTLNSSYQNLRKKLDAKQKEALTKAQRSWLKYREEWCSFELVGPPKAGMGEALYTNCIVEITKKQIARIQELSD